MTTSTTELPKSKAVKDLLVDLLGRAVTLEDGDPPEVADLAKATVAAYVDDRRQLAAVAGMDLPLAANVGASLGLIPKGAAEDCVEDGELSSMIGDNVSEVFNIMASLLNREGAPHLKLHQVYLPGTPAPTDAQARLLALGNRLDLNIAVTGYGSGRLWISLAG